MNSRRISVRDVLMNTALGRQTINALEEATPNGRTLELATDPIPALIVSNVKDCLGESGEEFGRRFHFSGAYANRIAGYGIDSKSMAAQFRMYVLDGIENPRRRPEVSTQQISMLIDVCGGTWGLSEETGMSLDMIRAWARSGIGPRSRWPYVFKMAAGWAFVESLEVMA